jgi:hypothetical protein
MRLYMNTCVRLSNSLRIVVKLQYRENISNVKNKRKKEKNFAISFESNARIWGNCMCCVTIDICV